jgi:sortase A
VMNQTKQPVVTLISCYPYLVDDQRIVVTAQLQSSGS